MTEERVSFPGAPPFWKRIWNPVHAGTVREEIIGGHPFTVHTPDVPKGGLVIYGYSARSRFEEDHRYENMRWKAREEFPSYCFSIREPDGEYGFTPLSEVEEISEEEFDEARKRGWR